MEPFRIDVEQAFLDDLRRRLRQTRWTSEAGWDLGTSTACLKELVGHWLSGFDWRAQEASLNRFSHFKADAGGERLHFIHQQGPGLPLLLLHGWPDSFYRFHKVIPKLAESFDVVVPSLPGFGFTGALKNVSREQPTRQGAQLLWRLMTEVLGFGKFAVAGGDGGSVLAQILAIDHPESVIGIHLTDLGWHIGNTDAAELSKPEQKYLESSKKQFLADGAYAMLQSTRPMSLAPALTDSPVALAAWIVDRFHSWCDGELTARFTKDELLTNLMIYWVTRTIGPSMATYRADMASPSLTVKDRVKVPVGVALFPKDLGGVPPRALAERTLNVRRWTEMPRGSHFAALEEPELYAQDLTAFLRELR